MRNKANSPSALDILETISDQFSMDIITALFNKVTNSDNLMQILGISNKQYYSRYSRLLNLGLINRKNGEIILTSFGRLVYKAQLKIANAFSHTSELRMIDIIQSHSGMSDEDQKTIIDRILDDSELKSCVKYHCEHIGN